MKISDLELCTLNGRKVQILESKTGMGIGGAIIDGVGLVNAGAMTCVTGKDIIKNALNLKDERRKTIDKNRSYDAITFTQPLKGIAIFDEKSCDKLISFRKASHEAMKARAVEQCKIHEEEMERKYPGITELKKAYSEHYYYQEQFQRAMEDEYNDGVNMPRRPTSNIDDLCAKYPRAAMYLKADSYSCAENYNKANAGDRAKALLDRGGSIEDAQKILDNWLPENAYWD